MIRRRPGNQALHFVCFQLSVLYGWVLWNAQVVVRPLGRERIIQELCEIHVHQKLGKKPCVVGEPGCKPGSQVRTYTKRQSSQPRELVSSPDPFAHARV